MKTLLSAAFIGLLPVTFPAQTVLYRCADPWDQPVFSDRPCGYDAQLVTTTVPHQIGSDRSSPATWIRISADNALRDAQGELERREKHIARYARDQDQRISDLRYQASNTNDNLAGTPYRKSVTTEMQAVTRQYDSIIESTRRDIDHPRERIESVRDAARYIQ